MLPASCPKARAGQGGVGQPGASLQPLPPQHRHRSALPGRSAVAWPPRFLVLCFSQTCFPCWRRLCPECGEQSGMGAAGARVDGAWGAPHAPPGAALCPGCGVPARRTEPTYARCPTAPLPGAHIWPADAGARTKLGCIPFPARVTLCVLQPTRHPPSSSSGVMGSAVQPPAWHSKAYPIPLSRRCRSHPGHRASAAQRPTSLTWRSCCCCLTVGACPSSRVAAQLSVAHKSYCFTQTNCTHAMAKLHQVRLHTQRGSPPGHPTLPGAGNQPHWCQQPHAHPRPAVSQHTQQGTLLQRCCPHPGQVAHRDGEK